MGVKYLKSILLLEKSLKIMDSVVKTDEIYVDFLGVFMSIAYSVTSTSMLQSVITEKFKFFNSIADKVVVFVDRGDICIKSELREKRKQTLKNQYRNKEKEIKYLEEKIGYLSVDDVTYEEQRENIISKIDKNNYYMFLANKKNVESIISDILESLNVETYYCDHIDAEFVICNNAKYRYLNKGRWPAIMSNDQDTLCLACVDNEEKYIYDNKVAYKLTPTVKTKYLVKLVILVNGCDFFKGLYGASINKSNFKKFKLYDSFTKKNILLSLAYKSYALHSIESASLDDINKIINFINDYVSLDKTIYKRSKLPVITAKSFLRTLVLEEWSKATTYYGLVKHNILQSLYNIYIKKGNTIPKMVKPLIEGMISYYENKFVCIKVIKIFLKRLRVFTSSTICSVAISPSSDLYLGFEKSFYFNESFIIENPTNMLNINI